MKPLYLDNAATTHISNEVLEEMGKSLSNFGNTEAKYYCYAEDAKEKPHLYSLSFLILLRDRKREYRKMMQRIEYWNYMDDYDKNLLK